MAATATPQSNPQTALRAGRLSSMRDRMGRTGRGALMGLSMLGAMPSSQRDDAPSFQNNPVAQMRADRHTTQRYANPGAMTPRLQEMRSSLEQEDTDQDDDSQEIDDAAQFADENDAAETMQLAARARSRVKAASTDTEQQIAEQIQKKTEELIAEVKTEISAKGMSVVDEGEMAEAVDTVGVGMSAVRWIVTLFKDSMNENTKTLLTRAGFPVIKMGTGLGEVSAVGSIMQATKWASVVFVIIPFLIVFTLLSYGSIGSFLHGGAKNALKLMQAAL